MKFSFENGMVEIAPFIDIFVIIFLKILFLIVALYFLAFIWLKMISCNSENAHTYVQFTFDMYITVITCGFKMLLAGTMVYLIFFYDVNKWQDVFQIPEQMPLSLLFTGILAIYELVSASLQLLQFGMSIMKRLQK